MTQVLQMNHVSKIYDNKITALNNVSIEVKVGELVSIIGPSGAGKSTLLRTINRMIDVTNGDIVFNGVDVVKANKKELKSIRKNVGMVFQHYNLVYRSSVLENVLHGRLANYTWLQSLLKQYRKEDIDSAMSILKMVGLEDRAYDRCSKLSGGQKQRVGIARALVQNPKMILCDEPIASLDPQSSKVIMEYLKEIVNKTKIPCLVNLHQVDVALHYSDRIIGMHAGEIVFNGKPEELTDEMIEKIYGVKIEDLINREKEN
ncbi:phosphonate ABC transporter ATP-binding protein [Anaerorhabdus sp.]|uniref:phosphonate ABC transporter ATP-binding protein n=1 Tax=Anaerorhabdus sp. TaxID=1872524 RepID=UPI002B1F50AF|nr:phosphonate ABC transporter ATP-binding protein [Anaerorhabdus sp.]MEA4875192.1 phosphonate ABC transporter ATP-binding protein [Anaerorhabdus sp.]